MMLVKVPETMKQFKPDLTASFWPRTVTCSLYQKLRFYKTDNPNQYILINKMLLLPKAYVHM